MARKLKIPVCGHSPLVQNVDYLGRVEWFKAKLKKHVMTLGLRHLNPGQDGRVQELAVPLPIYPGSTAAQFFAACGVEVAVGKDVHPDEAVGRLIIVRFGPPLNGTGEQSFTFRSPG